MVDSNAEKCPVLTNNTDLVTGIKDCMHLRRAEDGLLYSRIIGCGYVSDIGKLVSFGTGTYDASITFYPSNLYIEANCKLYKWLKK